MGAIERHDFSLGWLPSADAVKAPKNCVLRADNLVLDEIGALALRPGSAKINSSAFASTDIHSLFTVDLSGTRYRMSGATDAVFANGTSIATGLNGSNDISFGAHMGHILFARGTSKKKYDGTTVRNLGIAAPGAAPTLSVLATDSKIFANCSLGESPGMLSDEGTQSFQPDKAGTGDAAVQIIPATATGRGTSTLTYAAPVDFTTYTAGQVGTDDDLIDMYVFITEPQYISSITLMIDVNDGTFQEDWYEKKFTADNAGETGDVLNSNYEVQGFKRDTIRGVLDEELAAENRTVRIRADKPSGNVGWNHFFVTRGSMDRHGLTAGKNWSTVKAVRITFTGITGGSGAALRFDEIRIVGGSARPLTGKFKAAIVAAYNSGTYVELSPKSAYSTEIELKAQGVRATIDATTIGNLDSQVNELHLYLMGGGTDAFYRFTVKTGGPFSGSTVVDATSSIVTAMAANVKLDTDTVVPPDTTIAIEGPHYDRTLYLTSAFIYPSRRLNPGSCGSGEAVRVGDATETALWIKKLDEQIYVGTTRDIYRMDGDWTPQPDGSINVFKRPMGVSPAPISSAVAVGSVGPGHVLVYLASDGWHVLGAGRLTDGAVDLLWKGYTRHGVDAPNVTSASARFKCAITNGTLYALTPEGTDTTSSVRLHAYNFTQQRWYRFVYPQAFRSLYAEPDGTLIAGDASGYVRTLDETTHTDDAAAIAVVLWTPVDDNGEPFTTKEVENYRLIADTGSSTATVAFHINGSSTADTSTTVSLSSTELGTNNVTAISDFRQIQQRLTGSFSTFVCRGFDLTYLAAPDSRLVWDTNFPDVGSQALAWLRFCRVKVRASGDLTVTPYFDGTAAAAQTIAVGAQSNVPYVFETGWGREAHARQPRVVVSSTTPFQLWWIELQYNESGKTRQKRISRFPG